MTSVIYLDRNAHMHENMNETPRRWYSWLQAFTITLPGAAKSPGGICRPRLGPPASASRGPWYSMRAGHWWCWRSELDGINDGSMNGGAETVPQLSQRAEGDAGGQRCQAAAEDNFWPGDPERQRALEMSSMIPPSWRTPAALAAPFSNPAILMSNWGFTLVSPLQELRKQLDLLRQLETELKAHLADPYWTFWGYTNTNFLICRTYPTCPSEFHT